MPLKIENKTLHVSVNTHPAQIFKSFPTLCETSKTFKSGLDTRTLDGKEERVLYVNQHEIATISPKVNGLNFKYIASDDATTCHIVVLIEKSSGAISVGHFDGGRTEQGLDLMLEELTGVKQMTTGDSSEDDEFQLYLFGGFLDQKGLSEKLFSEIIDYCVCCDYDITLEVACCCAMNDIVVDGGKHACDIYGIAVDIDTQSFSIAKCVNKGPDNVLRATRMHYVEAFSSLCDYRAQRVYIEPFTFKEQQYTTELLELDDATYLKYCSTSPHCEPEHFVRDSKECLLFRRTWSKRAAEFFNGQRREYVFDDGNCWRLVDPKQLKVDE